MKFPIAFVFVAIPLSTAHSAVSTLQVFSVVREIIGTTAVVNPGGTTANTNVWSIGDSARFIMRGDDGLGNPIEVGMEIVPTASSGYAAAGTDTLMIARTVNSQGLTDAGTFSIYVNPTQSVTAGSIAWSMDFSFRFYTSESGASTFATRRPITLMLNNLDIDFGQVVSFRNEDYSSFAVETNTALTADGSIAGYTTFRSPLADSSLISNPRYAVVGISDGGSELHLRLAHNSQALFMFESRNPPINAPMTNPINIHVPEPSSSLLGLLGFGLLTRRQRVRAAA